MLRATSVPKTASISPLLSPNKIARNAERSCETKIPEIEGLRRRVYCEWMNIGVAMLVFVNCKREVHSDHGKQLYPCYCTSLHNMNSLTELLICSSGLELVSRKCLDVGLGHIT